MPFLDKHGIGVGGANLRGRRLIDFHIQDTAPNFKKTGDVWVKTSEIVNNTIINDIEPPNFQPGDIWQKVDRLDYSIKVEEIEAFVGDGKNHIFLSLNYNQFLSSVPENKQLLWENVYMKAFGNATEVTYYDPSDGVRKTFEGFQWNGISWVQISFTTLTIYDTGLENLPLSTQRPSYVTFNSDHIFANANDNGVGLALAFTTNKVDLTNFDAIHVDWECYDLYHGRSFIVVSTISPSNLGSPYDITVYDKADLYYESSSEFSRRINTLDISSLQGEFYLSVGAGAQTIDDYSRVKIYKWWVE